MQNQLRTARDKARLEPDSVDFGAGEQSTPTRHDGHGSLESADSRVAWENGHVVPEVHYRRLLCDIYGSTEEELGFQRSRRERTSS